MPDSFVYPARSLLSGSILPASPPATEDAELGDLRSRIPSAPTDARPPNNRHSTSFASGATSPRRRRSVSDTSAVQPTPEVSPKKRSRKRRHGSAATPNYSHFPAGAGTSTLPRTFSATIPSQPSDLAPDSLAVLSASTSFADVASPTLKRKPLSVTPPEPRARPKQVPVSDDPLPPEEVPDAPDDPPPAPWNTDIVHLPPLPPSSGTPSHSGGPSVAVFPRVGSSLNSRERSRSRERSASGSVASQSRRQEVGPPEGGPNNSSHSSLSNGVSGSFSGSASGSDASEQFMTVRFQHTQDEHGHHVIVGREGKLSRCEDEPIRTPGAVQGFGVLIAVEEADEVLVVRQVSENAEELLGLSPHYLFSLDCFTDTLPETQAGLLWDNLAFLSETDLDAQDEEGSPHVFLLTGWGAPGSAKAGDATANGDKRVWTCWCAVHRPSDPTGGSNPATIIMEFELERDSLNPLYPPLSEDVGALGSKSPGSVGSGSAPGTDGTERATSTDGSSMTLTPGQMPATPSKLDDLGPPKFVPSAEDILESTTSRAKPLPALERLRRMARGEKPATSPSSTPSDPLGAPQGAASRPKRTRRGTGANPGGGVGMMDVFAVMAQINEQLGDAPDLQTFLQVVVGVIKDLSQFHRVLVYQFDESWNGQVVAELMDWSKTHDLYRGLHFPAADIPAQARQLYAINKVRLLYDRSQATARIIVRNKEDLTTPLNMTHCYLRAMSPIHIRYLENMGVRASMSVSIMAFGALWGLVSCHSYGIHGMRVSFPVRQMLRLLSQSISRNIERLSYAQRLTTRKLINTMASDNHPTGYIVSNADDLLGLFDADFGVLVIGQAAKMLGPNDHGQEILVMTEYLRLKQFTTIQVSQGVTFDFDDLALTAGDGLDVIAGMLYVPLSSEGKDFICFLRKGQPRDVHWAGNPNVKLNATPDSVLEPRKSFAIWSETLAGRCRAWTDEQLETAGVLALVYGKFIEVWRQKENALHTTRLTNLLLSNASHEVRTPLNAVINYLELALNGELDDELRDNLSRSHAASKSLLFTINDLLDLTRLESGNETSFNEPFDLCFAIEDATHLYRKEAQRRNIDFKLDLDQSPKTVVGDVKKIRTVVQNLTANALKYTESGIISVGCKPFDEPEGLRGPAQTVVEILVTDTGCGIPPTRLSTIFRDFERVDSEWTEARQPSSGEGLGVGLGLAVVARIVEQLGGQLRVESKVGEGSQFSFLIPLALATDGEVITQSSSRASSNNSAKSLQVRSRRTSLSSSGELDSLVEAISSSHMISPSPTGSGSHRRTRSSSPEPIAQQLPTPSHLPPGIFGVSDSNTPLRPVKVDAFTIDAAATDSNRFLQSKPSDESILAGILPPTPASPGRGVSKQLGHSSSPPTLRVLIVEDEDINRMILAKRLRLDAHEVETTTNGQEALDKVTSDRNFDVILMDIQMPILDGYGATKRIRSLEKSTPPPKPCRSANGGHIPILAVSASLMERNREELANYGVDGWLLKPIDFKRLKIILQGVTDKTQRQAEKYFPGCSWEAGGWLSESPFGSPS